MDRRTGPIREARRCYLDGFRLVFNKRGLKEGDIFANIMPSPGDKVWGVIYLCDPQAIQLMDKREGVSDEHYRHLTISVITEPGIALNAFAYIAGKGFVCEERAPQPGYLAKILSGAREHELPAEYIAMLERIASNTIDGEAN